MATQTTPRRWSWVLLFTTSGTLLCCALPITLVSLGMGATVASMAASAPWLITLSQHKGLMFLLSALLISLASWVVFRPGRSCPVEPEFAAACRQADRWNRIFIGVSALMWLLGFAAAYLLPLLVMD